MGLQAIVITEDHYNALGMVRSLGEQQIPVILMLTSTDTKTFVDKSKYVTSVVRLPHNEPVIVSSMIELTKTADAFYLFPLSDFASEMIDRHYLEFGANVHAPNIHGEMLKWQDKSVSKSLAEQCGMFVSRSMVVPLRENITTEDWSVFPSIIKPLVSLEGAKSHISIVNDQNEMHSKLEWFFSQGYKRVLVEEYIHADDEFMIEVMGCAAAGKVCISGIIKKIREYPMGRGSTSYAEIVERIPGLDISHIETYIDKLGFDGLFDVEFKYAEGKPYFIECNFRNGAPGYALTCLGRNLPVTWINCFHEERIQLNPPKTGKKRFMCEQTDVLNMLKKEVSIPKWLIEWKKANHIFSVKGDRKPSHRYYSMLVLDKMRRLWRKQSIGPVPPAGK